MPVRESGKRKIASAALVLGTLSRKNRRHPLWQLPQSLARHNLEHNLVRIKVSGPSMNLGRASGNVAWDKHNQIVAGLVRVESAKCLVYEARKRTDGYIVKS